MHRQIKSYSSPVKLIIPIISFVLTAHIPLTSLSRVFFNFLIFPCSYSAIFWNCNNYALTAFLFLLMFTKSPRVIAMICSLTEVPQGFASSFSSTLSGTWTYHFSFHSFLTGPNERPQPHCHVSFCIIFVYVSSAQARASNMANCLTTLLAHYYRC